jgi:hypothetical protein
MQHFDHQDKVNCRDFSVCEILIVFGPRGVAVGHVLGQSAIFTQLYKEPSSVIFLLYVCPEPVKSFLYTL